MAKVNNYRLNPYTDSVDALAIVDEVVRVPAVTPYRTRLAEIPLKTSPSTMSARIFDTLAANITSTTATTITVGHGTWHSLNEVITIDAEQMQVTGIASNTLTVTRGYNSTVASTHSTGTEVFIENSMVEVSSSPLPGQFWPDYSCIVTDDSKWNTGLLQFNAADAGKTIAFSYNGLGTLIDDRAVEHSMKLFDAIGTFIVPEGITEVWVSMCGGGGGGGGGNSGSGTGGSGGGGAHAIIKKHIDVTPGESIPIAVGTGGGGGNIVNNGSAGGMSSFGPNVSTPGGGGGLQGSLVGGTAGGIGGAKGTGNFGNNGGNGGGCIFGAGGTGGFSMTSGASSGGGYGSGGGGGYGSSTNGHTAGANGSPGFVLVEW